MSTRRQLYDLLLEMPDGNAAARIASLGAFLDSLPPDEAAAAERRILALTIVYRDSLADRSGTLDDFFARVDEVERGLLS